MGMLGHGCQRDDALHPKRERSRTHAPVEPRGSRSVVKKLEAEAAQTPQGVRDYIESMLEELAELAGRSGELRLATSLRIVALDVSRSEPLTRGPHLWRGLCCCRPELPGKGALGSKWHRDGFVCRAADPERRAIAQSASSGDLRRAVLPCAAAGPVSASVSTGSLGVSLTIEAAGCVLTSGDVLESSGLESFELDSASSRTRLRPADCGLRRTDLAPEPAPASVTSGARDRSPATPAFAEMPTAGPLAPAPLGVVTITY